MASPEQRAGDVVTSEKQYVVGFVLTDDRAMVALVRKNRPEWQAGLLNGIGGKVEQGETLQQAMAREFSEEAGVWIDARRWDHIATIRWGDDHRVDAAPASVAFFRYVWRENNGIPPVRTLTDEEIVLRRLDKPLPWDDVIPNLAWLLPLAAYTADIYEPIEVKATVAEIRPSASRGFQSVATVPVGPDSAAGRGV